MLHELLFEVGPAITAIFKLGYEPEEKYFYEFTEEHYNKLQDEGTDITEKWYMLIPEKYEYQTEKVMVVREHEKNNLIKANAFIANYCKKSDSDLGNYDNKLKYVASLLPAVFTKNTKYQKTTTHLKIV